MEMQNNDQVENVNLYSMEQTTSQVIQENENSKEQLLRQLMDVNSQKELGENLRKRLGKLDREIQQQQFGRQSSTQKQNQNSSQLSNSFKSSTSGKPVKYSEMEEREAQQAYEDRAQTLRDTLKIQSQQNSFQPQMKRNQSNSQQNGDNSSNGVHNQILTHQKQNIYNGREFGHEQQQFSEQPFQQGEMQEYEQEQRLLQDRQSPYHAYRDMRGSQRSEELYLKGLKKKIEHQNKTQHMQSERRQEEILKCTFSPTITTKAQKLTNYMDIVQKTEIHYVRKEERERGRQIEIEELEDSQCTFSPQFCKKSMVSFTNGSQRKSIYERQLDWQKDVTEKREKKNQERWNSICQSQSLSRGSNRRNSRSNMRSQDQIQTNNTHLRKPDSKTYYQSQQDLQSRSFSNMHVRRPSCGSPCSQNSLYRSQQNLNSSVQKIKNQQSFAKKYIQSPTRESQTVQNKLSSLLKPTNFKNSTINEAFSPIKNEITDTLHLFNRIKNSLNVNQEQANVNRQNRLKQQQQSGRNSRLNSQNSQDNSVIKSQKSKNQYATSTYRIPSVSPDILITGTLKPKQAKSKASISYNKSPQKVGFSQQNESSYRQYTTALSPQKILSPSFQKVGVNKNRYIFLNESSRNNSQIQDVNTLNKENQNSSHLSVENGDNFVTEVVCNGKSRAVSPHHNSSSLSAHMSMNSNKRTLQNQNTLNNSKKQISVKENQELKNLLQVAQQINSKIKNLSSKGKY